MNDAQKLLDLFYRLRFVLASGVRDEHGYGNRDEDIAGGKLPVGDVFEGCHVRIYSNALNLRAVHEVERDGRSQVTVYAGRTLHETWEVRLSCSARGQMTPEDAAHFSDALAYAVKVARSCEEILARPLDFDIRAAREKLDAAVTDSWASLGKEGDPDEAVAGAWTRLGGDAS